MGSSTKKSSDQLKFRLRLPVEHRDTMHPCPSCGGEGASTTETGSKYRLFQCRWCSGTGIVSLPVTAMFQRWLRIKKLGKETGRCKD